MEGVELTLVNQNSREKLSKNGKFHAMLATKNIPEAIAYYQLFKQYHPSLNVVAVFDNNIETLPFISMRMVVLLAI